MLSVARAQSSCRSNRKAGTGVGVGVRGCGGLLLFIRCGRRDLVAPDRRERGRNRVFVAGALGSCIAFAGTYYPPTIRATGIGWAIGVGRLGSILGPVVGGILLALNLSSHVLFGVFAIPATLAVICSVCLRRAPERSGMTDDYAHSPKMGAQAINDVRG